MPAGQGDRQLDLAQGGRGEVPRERPDRPQVRRGGGGDGLRRAGPGGDATRTRSGSASAPTASWSTRSGFPPEDIIFDPEHPHRRHRHGGAQQLRRRLHRRHALDQGRTCPTPRSAAACRTSPSASAATTGCARRCTRRSCTTPSRAGMDMGIVNAGMLEVYEEIEPELRELVEDVLLNRRPDATERLVEFGETAEGRERRRRPPPRRRQEEWRNGTRRGAPVARAGQGHRQLHRRRHRGGAGRSCGRPLPVIEGPADGRA